MNEVTISKDYITQIVKKQDVWLVYTKNNKCWVCKIDGIKTDNNFYNFKLFINDTNQKINFWIKKKFFEKFFNFEFFYNYEEKKWFYKRSKNERTK